MNKRERAYAALEGQRVDRIPLVMWRHFYKQAQTPPGLASVTLTFYHQYDLDLIKLTPNPYYAIEDWGAVVIPSKDDDTASRLKKPVINEPDGWRQLTTLSPREGSYGEALEAIRLVANQLGDTDGPLLMTLFSPLTLAHQLAGDKLFEHLENARTDVHIGLATIAETTSRFAAAALDAGADGIFFVSELSRSDLLSVEKCEKFVIRYDLIALERVKIHPAPLVLHLDGANVYFDTVNQYPVHAVCWQNYDSGPSLAEALTLTEKTLMAGLNTNLLANGNPTDVTTQIEQAMRLTNQQRLILSPTRALPPDLPDETLDAVISVDRTVTP